jgi:hypothetical protein
VVPLTVVTEVGMFLERRGRTDLESAFLTGLVERPE